ncbi:unnamed protein product [Symbiodinium natans]|uniref:Uncharacterized protein n=1 Tax=Symbiodinium natans TaxID=878477 RepID=A0A812Q062_9DINO|nr:unnamed protein product [Symbiodinium natans]
MRPEVAQINSRPPPPTCRLVGHGGHVSGDGDGSPWQHRASAMGRSAVGAVLPCGLVLLQGTWASESCALGHWITEAPASIRQNQDLRARGLAATGIWNLTKAKSSSVWSVVCVSRFCTKESTTRSPGLHLANLDGQMRQMRKCFCHEDHEAKLGSGLSSKLQVGQRQRLLNAFIRKLDIRYASKSRHLTEGPQLSTQETAINRPGPWTSVDIDMDHAALRVRLEMPASCACALARSRP